MTGPEHFQRAEELAAKAAEYLGQGDGQDNAAVWAAVAQVHATLALATATGGGASGRAVRDDPGPRPSSSPRLSDPDADFRRKGGVPGIPRD